VQSVRLCFDGGCGVDAQGMDISVHQISDSRINEPVTVDQAQVLELFRDNSDVEMSSAGFCTCMADMFVAFVRDLQFDWFQRITQAGPDFFDSLFVHGRTSLNGFTFTL